MLPASVQFENDTALDLSEGSKKHGSNFICTYLPIKLLYGTWLVLFRHKKKTVTLLWHAASCCASLWSASNFSLILWERHDGGQQCKIDPQSSWPMDWGCVWKSTHATSSTYGAKKNQRGSSFVFQPRLCTNTASNRIPRFFHSSGMESRKEPRIF